MKEDKDVALSNPKRIFEILKENCNQKFTTRELAEILTKKYSKKCEKKIATTKVKDKKECIRQVAAEIQSNVSENYFDKFDCVIVEEKNGVRALLYKCDCKNVEIENNRNFNKEDYKCVKNVKKEQILIENHHQIILQGPPGTGKTRLAKIIAINLVNQNNTLCLDTDNDKIKQEVNYLKDQIKIIQFHPSYTYEDFVRGIVAKPYGRNIKYQVENKILIKLVEEAIRNQDKKYVLIIDEINRANLSSVLGELIYALEYRGEKVEGMYELNGNREIILPENLYIIGTMNTADRSVGYIDYAIRRRFIFIDILPDKSIIKDPKAKKLFVDIANIFDNYLSEEFEKNDVMIGHSYFLTNDLEIALEYKIKPLLFEYVKDGVLQSDAKTEIEQLKA